MGRNRVRRSLQTLIIAVLTACATSGGAINRSLADYETLPVQTPVYMSKKVINNLSYLYSAMPREMPMCMMGYEQGDTLFVEELQMPVYFYGDQTQSACNPRACNPDLYLGIVHNHIGGGCAMSQVDEQRFEADTAAKLELIVCRTFPDGSIGSFIKTREVGNE